MTNLKTTKRALLSSVVALLVCFTMLLGTTFAWFTDSVTSAGNIIQTGTLDVEMYWAEGTEDPTNANWKDASTGAIFDYDNWEPGYVEVRHIKIANEGSLALKYKVLIQANGEVSDLADVIDVYYVDPAIQVADRAALANAPKLGTLTEVLAGLGESGNGTLEADTADTITIALKMQESAGNEYQNKSIGTSFSIQLLATQLTSESDSFDNQYDADATYPIVSAPVRVPAEDVSTPIILNANGMNVEVPATVVNNLPTEVTSISVAFSEPVVQNNTLTFASVELVDQNNNKLNLGENSAVLTITLPAQTAFSAGDLVYIYHDGELVDTTTVNADGTISYEAAHFCEVSVSDTPKNVEAYADEAAKLRSLIAEAKNGDTVEFTLTCDMYLNDRLNVPNGVTLVLNGNGHQAIVNTAYPFYVHNANIQMNDLTITGKATYAIFTKGAIWDYNGNNATVNASFNNVTVDLDKADNFPVTFNGMGNITMKDCTVKGAGLPSGDYADGMHVFAGAEINLTVDGGEIGGIMLNSNYAAAATMDVKNGAVIEKVDLEVSSASDGSNVVAPVTVSADSTVKDMFHAVYSANQLVKVLEAGGNALLVNNITTSNKLTVKDGAYLDGNGKTIDFAGNFNGYEKALNLEGGATVKNLNVANAGRAYGSDGNDGDIYLDNISGTNAHYFFNGDTTTNSNVYVTNSTLDGWISYGNANLFSFDNCVLKGETSRFYGICYFVVYSDAEFKNCTFDNFYMAMNQGALNSGAAGSVITIDNCVYVTENGVVKVTAENFTSLFMGDGDEADFNRMLNNATIIVDGVTVAN